MPTQTSVKNYGQLNTLRVRYEAPELVEEKDKQGKPTGKMVPTGKWIAAQRATEMVRPGKAIDAYVAHGQLRVVLEELPT